MHLIFRLEYFAIRASRTHLLRKSKGVTIALAGGVAENARDETPGAAYVSSGFFDDYCPPLGSAF
ncbi:MAG: hypothetical protein DMG55_09610 [Acidobacteria bacterium]|nr:MAG: hypothetical protein DMG55_09610 [Acidobacteriota bacterium]